MMMYFIIKVKYNNIPINNDLEADDNFEPSDDLPF